MAIGFSCFMDAARSNDMFFTCSSCVPCEKLSRATSIPACSKRSIILGERLAGPIVQVTTLVSPHYLLGGSQIRLSFSGFTAHFFVSLPRNRELCDDPGQYVNSLGKGSQRNSLIVPVHTLQVLVSKWEWNQAVRLHIMKP